MNMQSIATCKYSAALNRCLPRPMNHARRQRPLHQHPMGESVALLRLAPAPMAAPRSVGGDEAMPMMDLNTTPPINVMLVLAQVAPANAQRRGLTKTGLISSDQLMP